MGKPIGGSSRKGMHGMDVITVDHWDEALWREAEPIYYAAFPEHGRKSKAIIRNMFQKHLCQLHLAKSEGELVAMAITGSVEGSRAIIIDYFAVRADLRNKGIGSVFLERLKEYAKVDGDYTILLIEVEAEDTQTNAERAKFWEKAGFHSTDYVHKYIWVPEPYRAMYAQLNSTPISTKGEHLFSIITRFHRESFSKKEQ